MLYHVGLWIGYGFAGLVFLSSVLGRPPEDKD